MAKLRIFVIILVLCILRESIAQSPYANEFPYQKYGFNRESTQGSEDGTRFMKNNLRDQTGRLKANTDTSLNYNLDTTRNDHDLNQIKRGGTVDNLTHVQGEDFETDKSHKRKHIKSGFQNSYHKDENGSRSSYYEDSDDTGGKVIYDKRHGTRGDQADSQYTEGLKNGVSRDRYDDRKTGFDNRDLADRQQYHIEDQGKQHGFADNHRAGLDDRFEIVRRPYSDYRDRFSRLDDYDRYDPVSHWGYNSRLPPPPTRMLDRDAIPSPSQDFHTRRKITIFEDPRDDFNDPRSDRTRDNGHIMSRSEITRRFDYGPRNDRDRTPLRLRYRGL